MMRKESNIGDHFREVIAYHFLSVTPLRRRRTSVEIGLTYSNGKTGVFGSRRLPYLNLISAS